HDQATSAGDSGGEIRVVAAPCSSSKSHSEANPHMLKEKVEDRAKSRVVRRDVESYIMWRAKSPRGRGMLGLPSVAVATARRHPSNGCRARSVSHHFSLAGGRRPSKNGRHGCRDGPTAHLANLWANTRGTLLHATDRVIVHRPVDRAVPTKNGRRIAVTAEGVNVEKKSGAGCNETRGYEAAAAPISTPLLDTTHGLHFKLHFKLQVINSTRFIPMRSTEPRQSSVLVAFKRHCRCHLRVKRVFAVYYYRTSGAVLSHKVTLSLRLLRICP
ncbi:hypothetical protein DFH07DRAFT_1038581, partial [Mycena maculata]